MTTVSDKSVFNTEASRDAGFPAEREMAGEPSRLFTPGLLGALHLGHRVVHAPTTRLRALVDETPSPMMVEYYRQRASLGGLIITESAHPSHDSRGYLGAPGIYTDAHVEGWRRITDAVHAKGGLIVMQIAHDGRPKPCGPERWQAADRAFRGAVRGPGSHAGRVGSRVAAPGRRAWRDPGAGGKLSTGGRAGTGCRVRRYRAA